MISQRQLFLSQLAQTSPIPLGLEIDHAEGCWLYDVNGKKYLDLISGISVSSIGHRHPAVVEAIKAQVDKYLHVMVYGEYIQSPQVAFAKLLTDHLPEALNCVFFTNSGTEATEGAMKLTKRVTSRPEIIGCYNSYHGSTQGALSIAGGEWFKNSFRPLLPGTRQIRFNNFDDIREITNHTAAVFMEPIQAEAGGILPSPGYLEAVRLRCSETGTLLVFDEIQTAFGRTGSFFNFEQNGVIPDILLLGKALGGGMPLGAFIADQVIMNEFTHDPVLGHITTFGGHPVSCAAGKAAMEVLIDSELVQQVNEKETLFRSNLNHPEIKAIHGQGLLLAVEVSGFDKVQKIIRACIPEGLITDWFLFNDRCIRIAPPLIITKEEILWACEVIKKAIGLSID